MVTSALFLFCLHSVRAVAPQIRDLRTEYLRDPMGVDAARPRLTWTFSDAHRGARQVAVRVLVARTRSELELDRGSLWDSGRVQTGEFELKYAGKPLASGEGCYWKVEGWDEAGHRSAWSTTGRWSMGLLHPSDWKAEWITSPILADPANRPRTPIRCYRSKISHNPNQREFVTLDLGELKNFDRVVLAPARPQGLTFDIRSVQFPRQFVIAASNSAGFETSQVLADETGSDHPDPRSNEVEFRFERATARYVQLDVRVLGTWDASDFGVALGQFSVFDGGKNVSVGASVMAPDSLETGEWSAKYLTTGRNAVEFCPFPPALRPSLSGNPSPSRTVVLKKEFFLTGKVKKATLYGTARGFYEASLNGVKVSRDLLAPGFTDYFKRISYQSYDVTSLLRAGKNSVGALLGYGWYAGHMNLGGNAYLYGFFPQFAAQLEIELTDGRRVTVKTDSSWETSLEGPVVWSDLLDGEAVDLRKDGHGSWVRAWTQAFTLGVMVAEKTPPVRVIKEVRPVRRWEVRPGVWVYDVGQEITGWVRLKVDVPRGTHVVLRHAEAIKADGELDTASLWGTLQRDEYVLDGGGLRTLEPHFTYHGFRYFEISGLPDEPKPDRVIAVNIHSDLEEVSSFECSNPTFNKIMAASLWTERNLLFDVPAGCAARSERLAWTGDIRPCVQTAMFHFDAMAFFEKYAFDLRDDQKGDGRFTDICPHAHLTGSDICVGSPGWADAGVSLPWDVYVNTGDKQLLKQHYQAAKRWVDFVTAQNPDLIWSNARGMDWGDWLSGGRATPKEVGATAFFAHSTDLVGRMARALGLGVDARVYAARFAAIRAAFAAKFVSADGGIKQDPHDVAEQDAQGSYALALRFGLLNDPIRKLAVRRLLKVIERDGGHPSTGFWSSVEMVNALSEAGENAVASRIVSLVTRPSWGFMVNAGTTFWEAFDADLKTESLNHWTHSSSGEWLWRNVAGLNPDPELPGYRGFVIRPRPTAEVSWCRARYRSVRGPISVEWKVSGGTFELAVDVPVGSVATVYVPVRSGLVREGGLVVGRNAAVVYQGHQAGAEVYKVTSGEFHFAASFR